jgi:NADH-quinone oxidoreductase subunit N
VIAGITLIMGNLAAMPQKNFKRLLAYSSVAHAGFLLMALASAPTNGSEGSLSPATVVTFYLGAYLLMTLLAFLVITTVRNSIAGEEIESYKGLAKRSPFLAFMLIIAMASLAGIPLTAGFYGKLFVFKIAADQGNWTLLVIGLIGAAAGFYYYLKVAVPVFFSSPEDDGAEISSIPISKPARIAMILLTIAIIAAGVNPNLIISLFS